MNADRLKQDVWQANVALEKAGLVVLTWGNASGVDRENGVLGIKPSGIAYHALRPGDIVLVSLDTGEPIEAGLRPSSDAATHLTLYRAFPAIGGIVHTHSVYATSWAQSAMAIPCLGTTHADQFYGPVPLTRPLTDGEIEEDYEIHTGNVIVEHMKESETDIHHVPGALVPHHGPFVWGPDPMSALENAVALEEIAKMAIHTLVLNPKAEMPRKLLDKHFLRKHGPAAYYGQEKG
jgi:L-ribulose-5-phosphate 4-epimerase